MNVSEISAAMEAVLFACGAPVQKERLTELFDITSDELTQAGIMSMNAHKTIYVYSPEFDNRGQMIFRENSEMMIKGNTMGVTKTIKHLHDYAGKDSAVRELTKKLLATEEENARQLRPFL